MTKYDSYMFENHSTYLHLTTFPFSDPPGPPEITGYIEGETIRLGQTITTSWTSCLLRHDHRLHYHLLVYAS